MVVVFWVLVIALTGSLAGKLQGAEKNDASSYLPASAESTQELNAQARFTSKNLNPAVVVYQRTSGITAADFRKAAGRRAQLRRPARGARPGDRPDPVQGPPGPGDGRRGGPRLQRQHQRVRQRAAGHGHEGRSGADRAHHRARRQRRGSGQDLQGHRFHAAVRHPGRGHRAAAAHLPQPGAVAAADHVGGRGPDRGRGRHLPAHQARPDGQRPERRASWWCWCSGPAPTTRCC